MAAVQRLGSVPEALKAFQVDGKQYASADHVLQRASCTTTRSSSTPPVCPTPTSDWTWAEEKAAAEKLTNKAAGVCGDYQPVSFYEFYKALAQSGGSFLSPTARSDLQRRQGCRGGQVADRQALDGHADGRRDAAARPTSTPRCSSPASSPCGTTASGRSARSAPPLAWNDDIVVEPGNTQKANAVFMNATVGVGQTGKAAAAWKWARYLSTSPKTVETRLNSNWELPAVNDQAAFDSYLKKTPPANRQAVFDALGAIALPPVIGDQQNKMQDLVTQALEKASSGKTTVEQALSDAAAGVDALIKYASSITTTGWTGCGRLDARPHPVQVQPTEPSGGPTRCSPPRPSCAPSPSRASPSSRTTSTPLAPTRPVPATPSTGTAGSGTAPSSPTR